MDLNQRPRDYETRCMPIGVILESNRIAIGFLKTLAFSGVFCHFDHWIPTVKPIDSE